MESSSQNRLFGHDTGSRTSNRLAAILEGERTNTTRLPRHCSSGPRISTNKNRKFILIRSSGIESTRSIRPTQRSRSVKVWKRRGNDPSECDSCRTLFVQRTQGLWASVHGREQLVASQKRLVPLPFIVGRIAGCRHRRAEDVNPPRKRTLRLRCMQHLTDDSPSTQRWLLNSSCSGSALQSANRSSRSVPPANSLDRI